MTDQSAFKQIMHGSGYRRIDTLDIFSVVEDFLHSPAPGLELEVLFSYVVNCPVQRLSGSDRVTAIREVVNWLARSI